MVREARRRGPTAPRLGRSGRSARPHRRAEGKAYGGARRPLLPRRDSRGQLGHQAVVVYGALLTALPGTPDAISPAVPPDLIWTSAYARLAALRSPGLDSGSAWVGCSSGRLAVMNAEPPGPERAPDRPRFSLHCSGTVDRPARIEATSLRPSLGDHACRRVGRDGLGRSHSPSPACRRGQGADDPCAARGVTAAGSKGRPICCASIDDREPVGAIKG